MTNVDRVSTRVPTPRIRCGWSAVTSLERSCGPDARTDLAVIDATVGLIAGAVLGPGSPTPDGADRCGSRPGSCRWVTSSGGITGAGVGVQVRTCRLDPRAARAAGRCADTRPGGGPGRVGSRGAFQAPPGWTSPLRPPFAVNRTIRPPRRQIPRGQPVTECHLNAFPDRLVPALAVPEAPTDTGGTGADEMFVTAHPGPIGSDAELDAVLDRIRWRRMSPWERDAVTGRVDCVAAPLHDVPPDDDDPAEHGGGSLTASSARPGRSQPGTPGGRGSRVAAGQRRWCPPPDLPERVAMARRARPRRTDR